MRYCGHFLIKAEGGGKNYKRDHPLPLAWRPFTVVFLQRKGYPTSDIYIGCPIYILDVRYPYPTSDIQYPTSARVRARSRAKARARARAGISDVGYRYRTSGHRYRTSGHIYWTSDIYIRRPI